VKDKRGKKRDLSSIFGIKQKIPFSIKKRGFLSDIN